MEPAIMPYLAYEEAVTPANYWWRGSIDEHAWGSPVDADQWAADNPAAIVVNNADRLRDAGLDLYFECGDADLLNLHWGAEFLHRILWDLQIPHEYRLVRWADHVGVSAAARLLHTMGFIGDCLRGGRAEPRDIPLDEAERAYADWFKGDQSEAPPNRGIAGLTDRAPSLLRAMFDDRIDLLGHETNDLQFLKLPKTD